jgi:uncharacterized BrkB/YihY/UPF0761 family membrane protein
MQTKGLKKHFERTGIRWIINLSHQFIQDYRAAACQDQAAALTYMTLFALVPLMTVSYAVFSMVPEFIGVAARVQTFLFSHFVPESGAVIQAYFANFFKPGAEVNLDWSFIFSCNGFFNVGQYRTNV